MDRTIGANALTGRVGTGELLASLRVSPKHALMRSVMNNWLYCSIAYYCFVHGGLGHLSAIPSTGLDGCCDIFCPRHKKHRHSEVVKYATLTRIFGIL
jgi:hypothetical protein